MLYAPTKSKATVYMANYGSKHHEMPIMDLSNMKSMSLHIARVSIAETRLLYIAKTWLLYELVRFSIRFSDIVNKRKKISRTSDIIIMYSES